MNPRKTAASSLVRASLRQSRQGSPAAGKLRVRDVEIFSGQRFKVPQCVQRIDTSSTHGWQVRYGGTKLFSDHSPDGSGAKRALAAACAELIRRMGRADAPLPRQRKPSVAKGSSLPAGISGPIVSQRSDGGLRSASLSVLLPRFGNTARVRSIYIGSESTYTRERFRQALAQAMALRAAALAAYAVAAARARRRAARELKALLKL
jgi:hypothetical protein